MKSRTIKPYKFAKAGKKKRVRKDSRPICNCNAYSFVHRVGGKCKGTTFIEFYFYNDRNLCNECNCLNDNNCDVVDGKESIKEAECYTERVNSFPSEYLPISFI